MRLRDLADDEQAKPQSLLALSDRATEERLEQFLARVSRDGRPAIRDREQEVPARRMRLDADRHGRISVSDCIGDQIRGELPDASTVAIDGFADVEFGDDLAVGGYGADLTDNLLENRGERLVGVALQHQPLAKTPPREIQHIADKQVRARHALLHTVDDQTATIAQGLLGQQPRSGADRRKGIAQVMTE